jgi:hypothetical protein
VDEQWLRDELTVYALTQHSYRRGGPVMVNRWSFTVQPGQDVTRHQLEAVATLAAAAPALLEALKLLLSNPLSSEGRKLGLEVIAQLDAEQSQ